MIKPEEIEENVLSLLVHHPEQSAIIALKIVDVTFSNVENQKIAETARGFISEWKHPPGIHLDQILASDLEGGSRSTLLRQQLDRLVEIKDKVLPEYVHSQLDEFIRRQRMMPKLQSAYLSVEQGDLVEADKLIYDISSIQQSKGSNGLWMKDHRQALSFLNRDEHTDFFSTGIEVLDLRGISLDKKTISFLIAASGKGKCIAENELVLLPNGSRITIKEAVESKIPEVLTLDERSGLIVTSKVTHHWDNGIKKCVKLITGTGRQIVTTENHKYLTDRGWIEVKDIQVGFDEVAIPQYLPGLGKESKPSEEVRLLAYLIAERGLTFNYCPTFTNYDEVIKSDFTRCVEFMGDKVVWNEKDDPNTCWIVNRDENKGKHVSKIMDLLRNLNLTKKKSSQKFIPDYISKLNDTLIAEFLMILFSCDGSIYGINKSNPTIEYGCSSFRLVQDIQSLLSRLGIVSRVRPLPLTYRGKQLENYGILTIQGKISVLRFIERVGFFGVKKKVDRCEEAIKFYKGKKHQFYAGCRRYKGKNCSDEFVLFDKVKKIEEAGEIRTYDLTVEHKSHNFIASNMIAHNTWWLIQVGKTALQHHKKVLHITLELSEEKTAKRYIQAIFSLTKHQIEQVRVPFFVKDGNGVSGFDFNELQRDSIFTKKDQIRQTIDEWRSCPDWIIKEFPTSTLSVEHLSLYLDSLEREKGFKPDILIVDYSDLMKIDAQALRIDTGRLYRELRGLVVSKDIAFASATQGNRESSTANLVKVNQVSEDWSKIGTADNVFTYSQTAGEFARGLARFHVAKARDEADNFTALITQSYAMGQFCLDSVMMNMDLASQISAFPTQQ